MYRNGIKNLGCEQPWVVWISWLWCVGMGRAVVGWYKWQRSSLHWCRRWPIVGHHAAGHAQVGHHPGGHTQVGSWKLSKKRRLGGRIKKSGVAKRAKVHRKFPMRLAAVGHAVGSGHCPDGQPRCDQPVGQDAVGHPSGQVESLFF